MGGRRNILRVEGAVAFVVNTKGVIIIDAESVPFFDSHNLYIRARGDTTTVSANCRESGRQTKLSRLVTDAPEGRIVDHVNGNPLDNRRSNLRICSQQENRRNSVKPDVSATSRYKGVCRPAGRTLWAATIYCRGIIRLGTFVCEQDAARAYDQAARQLFGPFAALNFPEPGEQSAHRQATGTFANCAAQPPGGRGA